jgi:hypothetical protein
MRSKKRVLPAKIELEAGEIGLLAHEIALRSGDRLGDLRCRRARFAAGYSAQQDSLGCCGAFCRQLKARDADVVPGDAAKPAGSFDDKIVLRCLAHGIPLGILLDHGTRRAEAEINPILAARLAAERSWTGG